MVLRRFGFREIIESAVWGELFEKTWRFGNERDSVTSLCRRGKPQTASYARVTLHNPLPCNCCNQRPFSIQTQENEDMWSRLCSITCFYSESVKCGDMWLANQIRRNFVPLLWILVDSMEVVYY